MPGTEPTPEELRKIRLLARLMEAYRNDGNPFALVLGSDITPMLIDSLENEVLRQDLLDEEIAELSADRRTQRFRSIWNRLQEDRRYAIFSTVCGQIPGQTKLKAQQIYRNLAHLIAEDYFNVIITADVNQTLEETLDPSHRLVLVNGREQDDRFPVQMKRLQPKVKVLKLYGDANYGHLFFTPQQVLQDRPEIKTIVKQQLGKPVVIMGLNSFDESIHDCLPSKGDHFYYINPVPPKADSLSDRAIENGLGKAITMEPDVFVEALVQQLITPANKPEAEDSRELEEDLSEAEADPREAEAVEDLLEILSETDVPPSTSEQKADAIHPPQPDKITDLARDRLESQQTSLQSDWKLLKQKIDALRKQSILAVDVNEKFKLKNDIDAEEEKLTQLEGRLDKIDQVLSGSPSSLPAPAPPSAAELTPQVPTPPPEEADESLTGTIYIVEPTTLRVDYSSDQYLSFLLKGGLAYQSQSREILRRDTESLNRTLQYLSQNIETCHNLGQDKEREAWRSRIKQEGVNLYQDWFASDSDLSQKFREINERVDAADYLQLCFAGPRHHLGIPYELLHDQVNPLAIAYPLFRQVTGVPALRKSQTFVDFIGSLKRTPLRILLIAASTGNRPDSEVRTLREQMKRKLTQLKIKHEIDVLLSDNASIKEIERKLNRSKYHIVHYAGQSYFDEPTGDGSGLLLWSNNRFPRSVQRLTAANLASWMKDSSTVLFCLSSCVGATVGNKFLNNTEYLGVIDALIKVGVPIVLGYRWSFTDVGALQFSTKFYEKLLATRSPARATLYARQEVYNKSNGTDETWTSPILIDQTL
jgi:CHAT domain-containing protein